jgi:hypothetical protein
MVAAKKRCSVGNFQSVLDREKTNQHVVNLNT